MGQPQAARQHRTALHRARVGTAGVRALHSVRPTLSTSVAAGERCSFTGSASRPPRPPTRAASRPTRPPTRTATDRAVQCAHAVLRLSGSGRLELCRLDVECYAFLSSHGDWEEVRRKRCDACVKELG